MSEHPHLGNAPIREALIDFRVRLPSDSSPETLLTLTEALRAEFPKVGPIQQFQGEIQFSGEGPVSVQKGPQLLGYRLESTDGLNIAQIRIDGLTFSRLEPYESWDRMVEDTWVVWERYLARSIPLGTERIATRFINRIGLPPSGHLAEVFSVPPVVPDGRIDARAASMVLPGPRLPHWSTDRGTSREAHRLDGDSGRRTQCVGHGAEPCPAPA